MLRTQSPFIPYRNRPCKAYGPGANRRGGAALIEIAVCLPIILLTITATVSITSLIYLKQSLKISAYEACRVGIVPQAEAENVHQQVVEILDGRGVSGYTVAISPSSLSSLQPGQFLTVTVTAPTGNNVVLASSMGLTSITQSVSMMCEQ